jgi:TatD DNase family protein
MHILLDSHTHNISLAGINCLELLSSPPQGLYFSAGVHPCCTGQVNISQAICWLEKLEQDPYFAAVGEIGIHNTKGTNIKGQQELFRAQLNWAARRNKTVIIHSVKAYGDVFEALRNAKHEAPAVLHAFCANPHITGQLNKLGCFYSLGLRELKRPGLLSHIPLSKLLLETDNFKEPIADVYAKTSELLGIHIIELKAIIASNFSKAYPLAFITNH